MLEQLELNSTACVCLDHYGAMQRREHELELAAKVQQHLFPCCVPALAGVEIAAHAAPAKIVSGDYYDFFTSRGATQGVAIADVMGKGLPASMLMSNLQASFRILGPQHDELDALAEARDADGVQLVRRISPSTLSRTPARAPTRF